MPRHSDSSNAGLQARPGAAPASLQRAGTGVRPLGLARSRDGLVYVPFSEDDAPRPLIVLLHGAGGDGASMLRLFQQPATDAGCVLLLPDARRHTWDFLIDDFGPDVTFLDSALTQLFSQVRVDAAKIAIAGFSDGASYALTLGLANGDLFTEVMAFSPGFMAPPRLEDSPRVFVSHGDRDEVLPIDRCSRRLVPQLNSLGYDLTYLEFEGPHTVPETIVRDAMTWFLERPM